MAVPKRKTTPSRGKQRRSHNALKKTNVSINKTTGDYVLSHNMVNGWYNGKQIIKPKQDSEE